MTNKEPSSHIRRPENKARQRLVLVLLSFPVVDERV